MMGLHSVMLSPDSVNRVRPPKMTIPKTLAALPKSQRPTPRLLCFGKNEDFGNVREEGFMSELVERGRVDVDIDGFAVVPKHRIGVWKPFERNL